MNCTKCGGQIFKEYIDNIPDRVCLGCGYRWYERREVFGSGEVKDSDNGCAKAKAQGYDGKCVDIINGAECPFPVCFEDLTRKGTPRPLKIGDKRSINPGRPSICKKQLAAIEREEIAKTRRDDNGK